jgi:hypothetical protein
MGSAAGGTPGRSGAASGSRGRRRAWWSWGSRGAGPRARRSRGDATRRSLRERGRVGRGWRRRARPPDGGRGALSSGRAGLGRACSGRTGPAAVARRSTVEAPGRASTGGVRPGPRSRGGRGAWGQGAARARTRTRSLPPRPRPGRGTTVSSARSGAAAWACASGRRDGSYARAVGQYPTNNATPSTQHTACTRSWLTAAGSRDQARRSTPVGTPTARRPPRPRQVVTSAVAAGHRLRRYSPPTAYSAFVIWPSVATRTVDISSANTLPPAIATCCSRASAGPLSSACRAWNSRTERI